jgi:hypothetical protein
LPNQADEYSAGLVTSPKIEQSPPDRVLVVQFPSAFRIEDHQWTFVSPISPMLLEHIYQRLPQKSPSFVVL